MTQTSAIPQQIFLIIKNYYTNSRAKNLAYIELEYCFEDGTEDAWIEKLDKAMAPLIKHIELSLISLIRPANNLLKKNRKAINRCVVFVTTHSDPNSGDLHVEPDNTSSSDIETVSPIFVIVS